MRQVCWTGSAWYQIPQCVTAKKLTAEAEGLTKMFEAIDSLSDRARQNEHPET